MTNLHQLRHLKSQVTNELIRNAAERDELETTLANVNASIDHEVARIFANADRVQEPRVLTIG